MITEFGGGDSPSATSVTGDAATALAPVAAAERMWCNENDPYAVRWLRNLMDAGHLPRGVVDDRSMADVRADDCREFAQCHFFAGIGGWPLALEMAGWPTTRSVWTGSCPCQPYSCAGKRKGDADERNLWPEFRRLIAECRPATIVGEQVASKDGRDWLAGVRVDLEVLGYAVGAADLCAAGVGAPHIRQRLFWVADTEHAERWSFSLDRQDVSYGHDAGRAQAHGQLRARGEVRGLGLANSAGLQSRQSAAATVGYGDTALPAGDIGRLGDADAARSQGWREHAGEHADQRASWETSIWLNCLDGKARRIEPTIFPLAHVGEWGTGSRVGILRGAGNAIVPQVAAQFIMAAIECLV